MNNCTYCSELAINSCTSCLQKMCERHIIDHLKDLNKKHEIIPNLYYTDSSKNAKIQKKITKRINLLINLKNEIFIQTNKFIEEIKTLYAISIKKIDEKLNEFIKLSMIKTNFNYNEYQNYLRAFEFRIESDYAEIDNPNKYFSQIFFREIQKNFEIKHEFEYKDNGGEINTISIKNDQEFYISTPKNFFIFDSKTKKSIKNKGLNYKIDIRVNIPGLNIFLSGHNHGAIVFWEFPEMNLKFDKKLYTSAVSGLALTSDNKYIVCSSKEGSIKILNIIDSNTLREIQTSGLSITCMALTTNNKYIVSGTAQNQLAIWNYISSVKEYELLGHTSPVTCVIISRDDKFIVSGSEDNTIKIWDMHLKVCIYNLIGHTNHITTLNFILNDKYIISGSKDSTIRLWDLKKQKNRGNFIGHIGIVNCVDLSIDGKWLYSGSSDGKIRGWCLEGKIRFY